jgi:hypothetical protein
MAWRLIGKAEAMIANSEASKEEATTPGEGAEEAN